jgi:hypothetical protein
VNDEPQAEDERPDGEGEERAAGMATLGELLEAAHQRNKARIRAREQKEHGE